jgi:hypothetical protein
MTNTEATTTQVTMVIPCGAGKLDHAAPARDLYTGQMFRHTLAAAQAEADAISGRVLILSARYGLVELDAILEPYNTKMGDADSVATETLTAQALALGIDWGAEVYGMLPGAYYRKLDAALRPLDVYLQDVYEATAGIGEQRGVNRHVRDFQPVAA